MSISDTIKGLVALGLPTDSEELQNRAKDSATTLIDDALVSQNMVYSSAKIEARFAEITALTDEIDGDADTFSDLPSAESKTGKIYAVLNSSGTLGSNRKGAGLYRSNGTSWSALSDFDVIASQVYTNSLQIEQKEPTIGLSTNDKYWRGDKTWHVLDKLSVGLENADNTSDLEKPISNAQAAANLTFLKSSNPLIIGPIESLNIQALAANGTLNIDAITAGIWYYTLSATANFTLNFRGNASTALSSMLAVGQAISISVLNTSGATAYFPSTIQIDGVSVVPKFIGGTAISAGSPNGIDVYSYTIIKTAASAYTVIANQSKAA